MHIDLFSLFYRKTEFKLKLKPLSNFNVILIRTLKKIVLLHYDVKIDNEDPQ